MRKVTLLNEYGERYALNSLDEGLLKNLTGIGFEMEYSYGRMGNSWQSNKMQVKQKAVSGNLVIATVDPYITEATFLAFIRRSFFLTLEYETSAGTSLIDVDLVKYSKGEISKGALKIPVSFIPKTLWYKSVSQRATIDVASEDEMRYPYVLPARINDYSDGYMEISNDGSVEGMFTIEFTGGIVDPVIKLEVDGVEKAKVEISASISTGSKIIYSCRDGVDKNGNGMNYCFSGTDEAIAAYRDTGSTAGLTNLALSFDVENDNFFKIPIGNSKLHITADTALTNPVVATIYKYYKAV